MSDDPSLAAWISAAARTNLALAGMRRGFRGLDGPCATAPRDQKGLLDATANPGAASKQRQLAQRDFVAGGGDQLGPQSHASTRRLPA